MIVLDLETTGFSHKKDYIIEVSAVKLSRTRIVDEFNTLVKPPKAIPAKITSITGLQEEDFLDAPTFKEIAPDLYSFVQGNRIIGYNVSFDKRFLVANYPRFSCLRYQDYLKYIKKKRPNLRSYGLVAVARHFGFKKEGAHRARTDTELLIKLIRTLGC